MNIAEKLKTVAEREVAVHEAGQSKGYNEGYALGLKTSHNYTDGFDAGKKAEYDAFWDAYQDYGNRTYTPGMFMGKGWNAETLKPKYSIIAQSTYMMFAYCAFDGDLNDVFEKRGLTLTVDANDNSQNGYMFYNCSIKAIGTIDISNLTNSTYVPSMFNTATLETIRNLIPPKCEMQASCWGAGLVNLGIGGDITKNMNLSRCTKLSKDSVANVVNALSAEASGQTATFSKTAVNNAFEGGSEGAEWKALIGTKSNWTISLV